MHTHPHTLGDLAAELGRVRQAEAARERQFAQARGGTGGLRVARGPLATVLIGLAAVLTLVSTVGAASQASESDPVKVDAGNYFVQHPGPAGGQTGVDPFDPYAPVETGTGAVLVTAGFTAAAGVTEAWAAPPPLGRPGEPS